MNDTQLLDWLADNDIIEGFADESDDVYDVASQVAFESHSFEPTADDKRKALRILIERVASRPESEATNADK